MGSSNTVADEPEKPEKPGKGGEVPSESVPQTGDDVMNKTFGLAGMAIGAMAVLKMAKDKVFKTDKVSSSTMRMGVVNGRPTYNDDYKIGISK